MYSRLESYPVTTTRPTNPQHQILHYPLTKSAVLSSQASIQAAFPRPTLFIPSSRAGSHSSASGSSPKFSTEDVDQYPTSLTKSSTMPSQQPSLSHRALPQGRPLPQVPPLPMPPAPAQPPANIALNSTSLPHPSPIMSPSSPTTLHRPKRALPNLPPSPRTPQMACPSHLSTSPATPSVGSSDAHTPQSSSSAEPPSKLHVNPSIDLSPTIAVFHRLPPLKQQPQTRIAARRVNAEASSSKVQLSPRSPVSLENLIPPLSPPRSELKVQTPPLSRALTDFPRRGSNDRPKLHIQTPSLAEPSSAPFVWATHQLPQQVNPLPPVPTETETPSRVPNLPRRSSLDSLTTRSSALLSPGQALSPYRRPRSRRFSRSPQQYGFPDALPENGSLGAPGLGVAETRTAEAGPAAITGRYDHGLVNEDDTEEPISPMKFTRDDPDGERDDEDHDFEWNEATFGCGSSAVESPADPHQGVLTPQSPVIFRSTADEVLDKRLGRIRRRHGETVIREFDIDPRISLEKDKGKGRSQGVGRFVLSEGEEGETEDEDDFYQPTPWPEQGTFDDYQNYVSDSGYGYGHEQAQDIQGQPQMFGNPHFVGNAYENHQVVAIGEDDIDGEDNDLDTVEDAGNKTPAAMFPPRSVSRTIEIEDEMVFEKSVAILDDFDENFNDEGELSLKPRRVVTNASSVTSNEPVSSGSDLALSGYVAVNHSGSFRGTPPPSSRKSTTSGKLKKRPPLLSGITQNQSSEKFTIIHSASSSSSSFITPPPRSFQDREFQQGQNVGSALSIKNLGRRWFKEKGGREWEQRDYEDVIGSSKTSA